MLGKHSLQGSLFEADNQYLNFVGRDSFYGFLANQRGQLFRDEDFATFYCPDNGRPSVAPSLLANSCMTVNWLSGMLLCEQLSAPAILSSWSLLP